MSEWRVITGRCEEVLPTITERIDAIVTDPPYPDALTERWGVADIQFLDGIKCPQAVFWSATAEFPLSFSGIHIWAKEGTGVGRMYERVFERNNLRECLVFRAQILNNEFNAQIGGEVFTGHPAQKPVAVVRRLVERVCPRGGLVLDPYCGSGSTGVACRQLGRRFIGIECDPDYAALARRRIASALNPQTWRDTENGDGPLFTGATA